MIAKAFHSGRGLVFVAGLLVLQVIVLMASFGPFLEVSIFCTGPSSSTLAGLFGAVHLLFLGLLFVGALSLRFPSLRMGYAALLLVSLAALPVQASLVSHHRLQCDLP
jgi:hypothetical protein